ncbi:MAG: hypothetical protein KBC57_09540 [Neisseriaceae bacterium]|nr:hypothetical protein [Neisseriaceae bacterium]MBP6862586.1 hypothetical protein [Neisseriaceae bacterium]
MPHCIIEHSADLAEQSAALLQGVHQTVCGSELFDCASVKSRLRVYDAYCAGEQAEPESFVHVTIKLLQGRNAEQKKLLAASVVCYLSGLGLPAGVSLTTDMVDMDAVAYAKYIMPAE